MPTNRVHIAREYATFDQLSLYLVADRGDGRIGLGEPTEIVFREVDEMTTRVETPPTLRITEPLARALLDALAAHFGGTSEAQTLRQDYMAERKRVDRLIELVAESRVPAERR